MSHTADTKKELVGTYSLTSEEKASYSLLDASAFRIQFIKTEESITPYVAAKFCILTVNDVKVNIASYIVKPGDVIKVRSNKRNKKLFVGYAEKAKKAQLPSWLNFDVKEEFAKVLHEPQVEDLDKSINSQAIVEFYSK